MTDKRKPLMEQALVGNSKKGSDEISNFRSRLDRLETAKTRQLGIINYIRHICQDKKPDLDRPIDFGKLSSQLNSCGNYLVFHQYFTVNKVRLAKASFCKKGLLCQLCAIRRAGKQVESYTAKYKEVKLSNPSLEPFLLTLTVKNGVSLSERYNHLKTSLKKLQQRRRDYIRGKGFSEFGKTVGGVSSIEVTKSKGEWHPHCHMVVMVDPVNPISFPERPKKHSKEEWSKLSVNQKSIEKSKWKRFGELAKESRISK
ncbi:MAG: protein rep, partial [Aureispira sp.]|nr:protein rep [Aureispira sp.]